MIYRLKVIYALSFVYFVVQLLSYVRTVLDPMDTITPDPGSFTISWSLLKAIYLTIIYSVPEGQTLYTLLEQRQRKLSLGVEIV